MSMGISGDVRAINTNVQLPQQNRPGDVHAIHTDVALNALQHNNRPPAEPITPARVRIQSNSGSSIVNVHLPAKHQAIVGEKFALLGARLKEYSGIAKLATVTPQLDIIQVRRADNNELKTVHAHELPNELKVIYDELKLAYLVKRSGNPSKRFEFRGIEKGPTSGEAPFNLKSTNNSSAQTFLTSQFPLLSIGVSEERKIEIKEKIQRAEILTVKKIEAYERVITNLKAEIARVNDPAEKQALQKDLQKLENELQQLKGINPQALYWLIAFQPTPGHNAIEQAERLKQAALAATGDADLAKNLGGVLIQGREKYFLYCRENEIKMKNTGPTERLLKMVEENPGNVGIDPNDYSSAYIQSQLTNERTALSTEMDQIQVQSNAQRQSLEKMTQVINSLTQQRIEKYTEFKEGLEDTDLNKAAFETKIASLENFRTKRIERLLPYYVFIPDGAPQNDPTRIAQNEKLERLRNDALSEGYTKEEADSLVAALRSGVVRALIHDAQSLLPDTDPRAFATERVNARWPHLAQIKKDALIAIEAEIYEAAQIRALSGG